jgi:GxxExxY protein
MKRTATNTDAKRGADLLEGELTRRIIKCFYRVYDALGYGFLESVYQQALLWELRAEGLRVESEAVVEAWYSGRKIGRFRVDLLVEGRVILEIKASEILPIAGRKKLLNYLRSSAVEVGLLLHFGPKPKFQRLIYTNEKKAHRSRSE